MSSWETAITVEPGVLLGWVSMSALFWSEWSLGVIIGPTTDKTTGRKIKPWASPKVTMEKKAVKTVPMISLVLNARGITARNVDRPPTRIETPMVLSVSITLASLVVSLDS